MNQKKDLSRRNRNPGRKFRCVFSRHQGRQRTWSQMRPWACGLLMLACLMIADQTLRAAANYEPIVVGTLAGLARSLGTNDGTGSDARFKYPSGVAVDSSGNIYVADTLNQTIRKITPDGEVSTLAGLAPDKGGGVGSDDGTGSAARFNYP